MEPILLEEWLRNVGSSYVAPSTSRADEAKATQATSEFAANLLLQAWARIRTCVQEKTLTPSDSAVFDVLERHRRSLHLAESQAKLLLALLAEVNSGDVGLLGRARRFAVTGLLAWIRKSGANSTPMKQAPETLALVVRTIRKAMEERPLSDSYTCEVILLLGTISTLQIVSPAVRDDCLTTIATELHQHKHIITRGALPDALAGAALALVVSQDHLVPILRGLLFLWTPIGGSHDKQFPPVTYTEDTEDAQRLHEESATTQGMNMQTATLKDMVMLLHLLDYLGSNFMSRQSSQSAGSSQLETLHDTLLAVVDDNITDFVVLCASTMACVGLLRSFYGWIQVNKMSVPFGQKLGVILANLEGVLIKISERVVTSQGRLDSLQASVMSLGKRLPRGVHPQAETQQLYRCVSVAVSRCRGLPAHPCILRCLLICIFDDALYLDSVYSVLTTESMSGRQQKDSPGEGEGWVAGGSVELNASLNGVQVHVESFFFRGIGAMGRAMCDQYQRSSVDLQGQTEHLVSEYAQDLYRRHRALLASSRQPFRQGRPQYKLTVEKIHEAAFLTIVNFFSVAVRDDLSGDDNSSQAELAAVALDSLSCIEYFRRVRLREFTKVIQFCISHIYNSEAASLTLARSLPTYGSVIHRPGAIDTIDHTYSWSKDEVQTARILFYFRVLPMCLYKLPETTFATEVAPLMFLYLQHSSEIVSKASHALFVAFLSVDVQPEFTMKLDSDNARKSAKLEYETKQGITIREQLVAFYMQRALQTFPGVTPFQGLVAGVGAISRQLPTGSPATIYCLNCLVDKAISLRDSDKNSIIAKRGESDTPPKDTHGGNASQQKILPLDEMGASQKLQILLLHLILLVDLQVLPTLLKLMAKLILGLDHPMQNTVLAEAFDVVGGSDDYTRKPMTVPWLQTLSYLSFRMKDRPKAKEAASKEDTVEEFLNSPAQDNNPESLKERKFIPQDSKAESSEHATYITEKKQTESLVPEVENKQVIPISEAVCSEDAEERVEGNEQGLLTRGMETSTERRKSIPISTVGDSQDPPAVSIESSEHHDDTLGPLSRL